MARVARLRVYPVKGLDGIERESSAFREGGTLALDRKYALVDDDGSVVNAKRAPGLHDLTTRFEPTTETVVIEPPSGSPRQFDLGADREAAGAWLGEYLGMDLSLERNESTGFVDRQSMGPSLISTATLRTVASWFDELTVESSRRRMRANVEIDGVPAFWEDRLVGEDAPAVRAGDVRMRGVTPCGRCVVPARDPDTGDPLPEFRQRFVEKRRETFPEWADRDAFDHLYSLMIIARIPAADRGKQLRSDAAVEPVYCSE